MFFDGKAAGNNADTRGLSHRSHASGIFSAVDDGLLGEILP